MLSVIILTFNSVEFIGPCLGSIFSQDYRDFEVIVVDNGSKDGTVEFIKKKYDKITLIENKENTGACKARNQGIETAKGEWILILDCDIILEKEFLSRLLTFMPQVPSETGIIQPRILKIDKKTIYSTGIFLSPLRKFYDIGKGKRDSRQFGTVKNIFGACSAAVLYNRRMLDAIKENTGYFDERFFFLVEDVDLSWRAQKKGWKAVYYPEAVCYHNGDSSCTFKKIRQYLCFRNRYFIIFKNEPPERLSSLLYPLIIYDIPRMFYLLAVNTRYALKALKEIVIFYKEQQVLRNSADQGKVFSGPGNPLISIVIAGYNAAEYIRLCLDSIYNQDYKNYEIIFVDNGSTDGTSSILKTYPGIKIITNKINKGFCLATNQGIRASGGGYVLTLNSDVVLEKNFLSELGKDIKLEGAGLFGVKILKKDGQAIDSTGLSLSFFYRFFDRGYAELDKGQYDKDTGIFGPCAAAALYKKEMLEDIKHNGEYFDEDFFFLGEDFDLAWRAQKKKWKARFVPSAVCYHVRNSSGFNNKYKQYLSLRNRFFLLIKNDAINFRYSIVFLLYDVPRLIYMLFTNKYTFKAIYEIIKYTPKMLKKRYPSRCG